METTASPHQEDSQPRKRHRADREKEIQIVESPDLWLTDGKVVIRTVLESSPLTHTLYKVHKHTLGLPVHCTAFASLFDGPQAAFDVGSEQHDGVPVMDLPDAAEDVRDFLKALETQLHLSPSSPILKYDAEDIRTIVVNAFKTEWPLSLSEWDLLRSQREEALAAQPASANYKDTIRLYPDAGKIIRLARDCDVPDLLPVAFYSLLCSTELNVSSSPFHGHHLESLSLSDVKCLAKGRARLRTMFGHVVTDVVLEKSPQHIASFDCEKVMQTFWAEQKDLALLSPDMLLF
ncbi:hypothetical protein BV25DRAFT_1922262 [Artomyces pyxidatus]|uniref:Uncharacterized protein n=1 Tax=Artomyces pyxidatus TaxID=48021 RepID=A0ACB8SED5_9AGAM|nr:hypothetical protein BV25DRAFT_1922262 [Artomyces pyxidatus]